MPINSCSAQREHAKLLFLSYTRESNKNKKEDGRVVSQKGLFSDKNIELATTKHD